MMKCKYLGIGMLMGLVFACTSDDPGLPSNLEDRSIPSSTAMVTLLSNFAAVNSDTFTENDFCVSFEYPIVLRYNTDATIQVDTFEGLQSVVSTSSSGFHITGIALPITVRTTTVSGAPITVNTEAELNALFANCPFNTFREDVSNFQGECYTYSYPIQLLDSDGEAVSVASETEFKAVIAAQGNGYTPDFVFPFKITTFADAEEKEMNTLYEFNQIHRECATTAVCPELSFQKQQISAVNFVYEIRLTSPNTDVSEFKSYQWSIDDMFIENDGTIHNGDGVLTYAFMTPGDYLVCIKELSVSCEIPDFVYCETIEVR